MLPKKLRAIYDNLNNKKNTLSRDQKILLQELIFLDNNHVIGEQLKGFTHLSVVTESFSGAIGSCPVCGKKY